MKRIVMLFTLATLAVMVTIPVSVFAAEKAKSEVVMKLGNKLHLLHSGTEGIKKDVSANDILTVYRPIGKHPKLKEVGQVKVLSFLDEHQFEAEIVKGEIRVGDIAIKKSSTLLVQPAE